jgi:hypothetical protein
MTRLRARALAALVGGGIALVTVSTGVGHAAEDQRARRLLARASSAAYDADFTGDVVVEWHDASGRQQQRTEVASTDGVLHVGDDALVGSEQRMVRRTAHGWELLGTNAGGDVPDPARKYDLDVRRGPVVAQRPTWEVRVRDHGAVRERLAFDTATGVLLRRDQLDRAGHLDRRVAFVSFTVRPSSEPGAARVPRVTPSSAARAPQRVHDVPDALHVPTKVEDGYRLVTTLGRGDDQDGVQLFYSDGVVGLSVFEAEGTLDWDRLPAGGAETTVDGQRARVYSSAAGHALVCERDGVTYTYVSDAPVAEITAFAAGFDDAHETGWLERASRFVTGPFSWE